MEYRNKKGHHKIAIVGIGSMFPGAMSTKDFWLNIINERDFIRDVPETHWLKEDYYDPGNKSGDKVYCKKGAFLDDVVFDPVEFGLPPNLLSTTDTVQLLSLMVARDTLADTLSFQAGKVDRKKTSVILGVAGGTELIGQMSARIHTPEWVMAMRNQGLPESKINSILADIDKSYTKWNENTFPGLLGNVVSGRVANRFDLKGTNCVLDAACASSLAAVKMAVQELQLETTDMVLSGGADALNDIFMYMCFSKTTALSPTEDCRPFSDAGDGTVLGEGVAMIALKRLEDAERDGDRIYAVIASIGSSSDGKSGSIYAPDSNGQSIAIRRAYEDAGFLPGEMDLVEGHGTGTIAGDYAEFNGLKLGYGETAISQYCALGSVKSQIGHTKSAAGIASVVKVAMALNNKVLPPTIKVKNPNPKLNIENSPFYLNTVARPWIHDRATTRKAGVSSMGFGGTNFHVAMEEYRGAQVSPQKVYKPKKELILFSAPDSVSILKEIDKILKAGTGQRLEQVAKTSQLNFNADHNCRLAMLGESIDELLKWTEYIKSELSKKNARFELANSVYYEEGKRSGKLACLFSGQGSQYVNMGAELLMQYDDALNPWNEKYNDNVLPGKKLSEIVFPIPVFNDQDRIAQNDLLVDTRLAQPAIGTLAMSHLNLLSRLNVKPDVVGGHSYGEVAALYAAGVITSSEDLIAISRKRGELMASASKEKGAMTALLASSAKTNELLDTSDTGAVIANFNSPSQTVLTGTYEAIEKNERIAEAAGIKYHRLNVSTAFHSELVAGSAKEFETFLKTFKFNKAKIPVYANTTATPYPASSAECAAVLAHQLAAPVQFEKQVLAMYAAGVRIFLEVGPGKVLRNFVKDILHDNPHVVISMDGGKKHDSKDAFWCALGHLAVSGVSVDFSSLWACVDSLGAESGTTKPSLAAVKINGSNFGKPYPPKGGFNSLPKPNPENIEIIQPQASIPLRKDAVPTPTEVKNPPVKERIIDQEPYQTIRNEKVIARDTMSAINNNWLEAFQEIQKNTLDAQKNFQDTLAQSHKLFLETSQIAFQQLGNLTGRAAGNLEGSPRHNQYAAPSPVVDHAPRYVPPAVTPSVAPVATITPVQEWPIVIPDSNAGSTLVNFEEILFKIVSEKTGYPPEILDLSTDLESGLGIDSIKRVEILSALQEEFPALKNVDKVKLAAMNTLGEILSFAKESSRAELSIQKPTASVVSTAPSSADFKDTMLQIVAEKTGYPKEILDLSTDLESGLGIDSIKRVEILSALQDVFPELRNVDKTKLASMNTLGEILAFSNSGTAQPQSPVVETAKTSAAAGADFEETMFQIVSEKTGYPKEILDLNIDLESGLGIDSIKRVEILSALQDKFPVLKTADKSKLASLNTLGEILSFSREQQPDALTEPIGEKKKDNHQGSIYRYLVSKVPISDNGFGDISWKKSGIVYILPDDRGIATELEQLLLQAGANAAIVAAPPQGATAMIDLRGLNTFDDLTINDIAAVNTNAFQLAQTFGKSFFENGGHFMLALDNGLNNKSSYNRSWSSGLAALAKTARLEWGSADVRSVNIDTADKTPQHIAGLLFKAITNGGFETEIDIDAAGHIYKCASTKAKMVDHSKGFNTGDTIVVSGGARGVTAACLVALSKRRKLNFALLGRTELEKEPDYLSGCRTETELKSVFAQAALAEGKKITPAEIKNAVQNVLGNREVSETIKALTANGSVVSYYAVNITDRKEVEATIADVRKKYGSINGIIHAAGVLADKYIHEKTLQQFGMVFETKTVGFMNLLDATAADSLSHICCFSSVAARLGNTGQADYAMANEVLNKVCVSEQLKRESSCVVKSINWGPWDGGMVSPQLRDHFISMGVDLIPINTGAEIFADEMEDGSTENVEIVVGGAFSNWGNSGDLSKINTRSVWVHKSNNPYLDSHKIQDKVIVPLMMVNEWCMRLAKSIFPEQNIIEIKDLKVFKGIQLYNFDKEGDVLIFHYSSEQVNGDTLFYVKIESDKGAMFYHATIRLTMSESQPGLFNDRLLGLAPWKLKKKDIYNAKLFHGADFQVIDKLNGISEAGCRASLKLGNPAGAANTMWLSDMFLFDGGIQLATLSLENYTGNKSALPMGFESLHIYNQGPMAEEMHCELLLKRNAEMASEWDIQFYDNSQQVLAEMKGLRMYMYQTN
jgi:acyl transferase domain-containing protein/acyl carrier protein/NAD(P)-dependent dehydrogenase (short-subunit alcohol dehydrogenase family)